MSELDMFPFDALPTPVVHDGSFGIAAVGLAHSHIYGMCRAMMAAGATLRYVYEQDEALLSAFVKAFPQAQVCRSEEEVLSKPDVAMILSAHIPSLRADLGIRAMQHGKDYFCDKAPFTTLEQAAAIRRTCQLTGRKYMVYYSERLHNEAALYASRLIADGAIGEVGHIEGMGPHRLNRHTRPDWFFSRPLIGGILTDIGSHQLEQLLCFAGCEDATIDCARVANLHHPELGDFDDYGDLCVTATNGVTGYLRVDWNAPDGLKTWGDPRTIICGSRGYIELRKNCDIASSSQADHVFLVNDRGEFRTCVTGKVGFPFFGQLITDCLERTETAMTQEHALLAGELAVKAQNLALSRSDNN